MGVLVGYWSGDNNTIDSVNGNDGIWHDSPRYADGVINRCFSPYYDYGYMEEWWHYIYVPYNEVFNFEPTGKFTISFYFKKVVSEYSGYVPIIIKRDGGAGDIWDYGVGLDGNKIYVGHHNHHVRTLDEIVIVGTWYEVIYTYNNGTHTISVDGIVRETENIYVGSGSVPFDPFITQSGKKLQFGYANASIDIDEIKIYNDSIFPTTPIPQNIHGITVSQKQLLGFKLETTPYAPEALTSADYKYPVYDVKVEPLVESFLSGRATGDYSKPPAVSGRRACAVNFKVDLYALTDPATPPSYFNLFRACGWKQLVHGAVGCSVRPDSFYSAVPATIEVALEEEGETPRQLVYKVSGAMGNVKLTGETGKPIVAEFSFIGPLEGISTRSYANRIQAVTFDDAVPAALLAATCSLHGGTVGLESFDLAGNETPDLFSNISRPHGYGGARVGARNLQGSIKIATEL